MRLVSPLLAALLGSFSLLACGRGQGGLLGEGFGAGGGQRLLLVLPVPPPSWSFLPELRMALTWRGRGGLLRSALLLPGQSLEVEVDRGLPQAILALPSSSGRGLRPAGAIYPRDGGDELELDWRGGYAASLALALLGGGIDPWGFDLTRLADEACERWADPWLLPCLDAAQALAQQDFRIDMLGQARSFQVRLPGPGPWAPESPFGQAAVSTSASEAPLAQLPEGLWRFLGADEELLVRVDAEGRAIFVTRP